MINDIILLVAERADLPTLARLMLLCKTSYALIKKYQHSIVKGHLGMRLRGPLYPSEYAPCGRVLSQAKILEAYTFDMLQELDCRERSIEGLFSPGQPLHQPLLQNYPGFTDQADPSLQRLVFGLSRACMVLDRLSDCVADVCSNLTPAAVQLARAAPMDPFPLVVHARDLEIYVCNQLVSLLFRPCPRTHGPAAAPSPNIVLWGPSDHGSRIPTLTFR
ncbi:hypothetical protein GQ53DRAFT_369587 [Thozetella sp. PMI_491]|nr:hypothetical protein GQ53DRAFT_369587 [Thozetella sp. PMI_491]